MTMSTIRGLLAAAVATAGTFAVSYPTGKDRGSFSLGTRHKLVVNGKVFSCPEDVTISFGATSATVTYNGTTTLPQGASFTLQLDELGQCNPVTELDTGNPIYTPVVMALLNLGSPKVADADGILVSASVTSAVGTATVLTGALVAGGVAVMDATTGRNVVAAWTGTAILTVNGTDMYGNRITEVSASGTSLAGKKAFKTVTSFSFSANVTGCTIGSGDVLGLPAYVPNAAMILKESEDGALATGGTIVAGLAITTKPTSTNADVRGTYDPNSACDGSKAFNLLVALPDPSFIGATQYAA